MPTRRDRLRRRAFGWLLVLVIAVGAFATGEGLLRRLQLVEMESARREAEVGTNVVHQIVLRRLESVEVLHRLAQSWFLLRMTDNRQGQDTILSELAASANARQFGIVQVALIGRDGWMIWSSVPGSNAPVFLGDREHFQVHERGLRGLFVSEPLLGRVSNRWTVQLTRPLLAPGGGFGGVVVVSLDLADLSEALDDGFVRAGDRAALLREMTLAARSRNVAVPIGGQLAANDRLRSIGPSAEGTMQRPSIDGRQFLTGWRRLDGTPLLAIYSVDLGDALADFTNTATLVRATAGALSIAAFLVVGLLFAWEDRRMARVEVDRAEAERTLAEAAQGTYQRRIAGLPAVVYGGDLALDGGFAIAHVSDSVERVTGWSVDELMRRGDWRPFMEEQDAGRQEEFLRGVLGTGAGHREMRLRRPDGEWIWVRDSVRVVDARGDGSAEVVGYIANISEERAIEARAQANANLATLGEMATGLAHELNQPLAVMSLAAENAIRSLNRRGAEALPEVQERLGRIGQQARRARDIVDHLRVFGRPDEGALEPVTLSAAVEGAVVLTNGALCGAGIEVTTDLPPDLPPVMARLVPLEQALVNLLLNARDAICDRPEAARLESWIRIAARRDDAQVVLTVADSGGGIPAHVVDRLFEPFFTTKPPGKGTGLGLPIVHAAMRSFGGGIAVENSAEGAVFTMTFQTTQADPQA
jgi:PAS domain S-box-containing protein